VKGSHAIVAMAILAVWVSGCGTICNFAGGVTHPESEPRVYGGVARDLEFLDGVASASTSSEPQAAFASSDPKAGLLVLGVAMMDPALSFVGDTLTLPFTVYVQQKRLAANATDASDKSTGDPNALSHAVSLGQPSAVAQTPATEGAPIGKPVATP
jgi:hypothetical protein